MRLPPQPLSTHTQQISLLRRPWSLGYSGALELAKFRIRVNVVCPGSIQTAIGDSTTHHDPEVAGEPVEYLGGHVPLTCGEPGSADEVADLVAFLLSDRARHITGTPVWIDGAESLLVG